MTMADVAPATIDEGGNLELRSLQAELRNERQRSAFAERRAEQLHTDLVRTNEFLNGIAKRREWCDEYEGYVRDLNEQLAGFQFRGRARKFSVEVEITAKFGRYIEVEASTEDEARQAVRSMSAREVYDKVDLPSGIYAASTSDEVEVTGVLEDDG